MIARLSGTLIDRVGTHAIVDCHGVGYEVTCSAHTLAQMPPSGSPVVLRIFTHASENKVALFGFADAQERALFDLLITVKNVGPSTAISILSGGAAPRDIAELITKDNVKGLTAIKGVGKKTAELLVVELREKCETMLLSWTIDGELRPVARGATRHQVHPLIAETTAALVALGWKMQEAEAALADVSLDASSTLEGLLRQALRKMHR